MMNFIKLAFIALFLNPAKKETATLNTQQRISNLAKLVTLHHNLMDAHSALYRLHPLLPVYLIEPFGDEVIDKMRDEAKQVGQLAAKIERQSGHDVCLEHASLLMRHPLTNVAYAEGYFSAS